MLNCLESPSKQNLPTLWCIIFKLAINQNVIKLDENHLILFVSLVIESPRIRSKSSNVHSTSILQAAILRWLQNAGKI